MPDHGSVPFQAHVELLQFFVARRESIVERIQALLISPVSPLHVQPDRALLLRQFEDSFFTLPGIPHGGAALRGQLQRAHWNSGFQPRTMPGVPNEMFDPADMTLRAFLLWRHSRWPGRNGRVRYAQTLFNLYGLRCLALLGMRLCDDGPEAGTRLVQLQTLLDALWKSSLADQPVLVRDVRWLIPVAQSPTTDQLAPYFEAARRFEESLSISDQLEIHKASVLMAGGHLRSQLRHFTMQGRSLGEEGLVLETRRSNALDCAMTIQHLVPLLKSYETAVHGDDSNQRRELAGVICQGISPDPELFVNRLDLLGAYSMIEHLFVGADDKGDLVLTPAGHRHLQRVHQYQTLMPRLARPLLEDCPPLRPTPGAYSPYGVIYGFSSNILEHMALKALQPQAESRFSLEDVFADAGHGAERLAWVSGWRQFPHLTPEILKQFEYPQHFAEAVFDRVEKALQIAAGENADVASRSGRLRIRRDGQSSAPADLPGVVAPGPFTVSSDPDLVAAGAATFCERQKLLEDRLEGMHLVSYHTPGGWTAISKDVITEVLGVGTDLGLTGIADEAARALQLMYPGFLPAWT